MTSREDPNPLVVAEALLLGKKVVAFSDTGASASMASRFGYALTGKPDAERSVAVLPKILDGPWLSPDMEGIRREVDGTMKLERLQERLERFAEDNGPARSEGENHGT